MSGHGDPKCLEQVVDDVLSWPDIEPPLPIAGRPDNIPIRLEKRAAPSDSSAFIITRGRNPRKSCLPITLDLPKLGSMGQFGTYMAKFIGRGG